jgi:hypothetical protein
MVFSLQFKVKYVFAPMEDIIILLDYFTIFEENNTFVG